MKARDYLYIMAWRHRGKILVAFNIRRKHGDKIRNKGYSNVTDASYRRVRAWAYKFGRAGKFRPTQGGNLVGWVYEEI